MSDEFLLNRLGNSNNPYQGNYKRVLCVCSAGLLRSPTAAWILSQEPYNFNTRAAGLNKEFALIPVDQVLLSWCDEAVCMNSEQAEKLREMAGDEKKIFNLNIPDTYGYRNDILVQRIKDAYNAREE